MFNRVHALCRYLRKDDCLGCPANEQDDEYGTIRRGCRLHAEEVYNIAVHGNPWGKRGTKKNIDNWRKRSKNQIKVQKA